MGARVSLTNRLRCLTRVVASNVAGSMNIILSSVTHILALARGRERSCARLPVMSEGWHHIPGEHQAATCMFIPMPALLSLRATSSQAPSIVLPALCHQLSILVNCPEVLQETSNCPLVNSAFRQRALQALVHFIGPRSSEGRCSRSLAAEKAAFIATQTAQAVLRDTDEKMRCAAVTALAALGAGEATHLVAELLEDSVKDVRAAATQSLVSFASSGDPWSRAVAETAVERLGHAQEGVRLCAAQLICCNVACCIRGDEILMSLMKGKLAEAIVYGLDKVIPDATGLAPDVNAARLSAAEASVCIMGEDTAVHWIAMVLVSSGLHQSGWPIAATILKATSKSSCLDLSLAGLVCEWLVHQESHVRQSAAGILPLLYVEGDMQVLKALTAVAKHHQHYARLAGLKSLIALALIDGTVKSSGLQICCQLLSDSDAQVSQLAAQSFSMMGAEPGQATVIETALKGLRCNDVHVRKSALDVLGLISLPGDRTVVRLVASSLEDSDASVRGAASKALLAMTLAASTSIEEPPDTVQEAAVRLEHDRMDVRKAAIETLWGIIRCNDKIQSSLRQMLGHPIPDGVATDWVLREIIMRCRHSNIGTRRMAMQAFARMGCCNLDVISAIKRCLTDDAWQVRLEAVQTLEVLCSHKSGCKNVLWTQTVDYLQPHVEPESCVRLAVVHLLGHAGRDGDKEALACLMKARMDPDLDVQEAASKEISRACSGSSP